MQLILRGGAGDASTRSVKHRRRRTSRCPPPKSAHLEAEADRAGDEEEEHHVHVPFPLDHFFFCFFAPVAAGAILTDLLGVRWDVDGWSVDCLERAGRSGRE